MKRLISIAVLALSIVSCSACAKKLPEPVTDAQVPVPTATVPVPPPVNPLVIRGDHWEFTLPSDGWKGLGEDTPPNTVVLINPTLQNILVFEGKEWVGTNDVLTLETLRALRNSGATILSTKQVTLNGHNFVLIEAFKGTAKVWMWITATGDHAYAFSCGGPDDTQRDLCSGVANTLKIQ